MWFKLLEGGAIKSTPENLEAAAAGENFEWTDMYARMAKEAREEGFDDIAEKFEGGGIFLLMLPVCLSANEKVPLRVMDLPDPSSMMPEVRVKLELIREFKRLNPEIELSAFSGISIQNVGAESRLMLAIAGGAAPDVMMVNFRMSDTYIQQNFLYPLDGYIQKDPQYKSIKGFLKSMPEALHPVLLREGPAIGKFKAGNHVWMIGGEPLIRVLRCILFRIAAKRSLPINIFQILMNYVFLT